MNSSRATVVYTKSIDEDLPQFSDARLQRSNAIRPRVLIWTFLGAATALGAFGLLPVWLELWEVWTSDALRSIGALIVGAALVLILREWRQSGWELHGTWWGLVPLVLSFCNAWFWHNLFLSWRPIGAEINLLPRVLSLYLYASGVVLLFAGSRFWRRAWFPLALLLSAQPVPSIVVTLIDYPLQSLSARTARGFAGMIGFSPTNPELLKLMFSPTFGMFIAPGCDGIRGAVGLGYAALIAGYLKRVSWGRWFMYVSGGVLLGHIFNLIRLCALVLYYRVAIGHHALENAAALADYLIGGILFFLAVILFFSIAFKRKSSAMTELGIANDGAESDVDPPRAIVPRILALFVLGLATTMNAANAIRVDRSSMLASLQRGLTRSEDLNNLLPRQIGDFRLVRAWQEESDGAVKIESGIYRNSVSDEITLGVWVPHTWHNVHSSWWVRGDSPDLRADRSYITAGGHIVPFDIALYTDGMNARFAGNTSCTPSRCLANVADTKVLSLVFANGSDFATAGSRSVPFFFSVERPNDHSPKEIILNKLSDEAENFLSGVNLNELSRRFQ